MRERDEEQRARLARGLIEACAEVGFASLTQEQVCRHGGASEADFNRLYGSLDDCFCQTLEAVRDDFFTYLERALGGEEGWAERLRIIAYGLLRYLRADRARAQFLTVELHLAGERATRIWSETILTPLLDAIDEGRRLPGSPSSLSRGTAAAIGGAIFSRIRLASIDGSLYGSGEQMVPELMYAAVLPYLGPEGAEAELRAPAPPDPTPTQERETASGLATGHGTRPLGS